MREFMAEDKGGAHDWCLCRTIARGQGCTHFFFICQHCGTHCVYILFELGGGCSCSGTIRHVHWCVQQWAMVHLFPVSAAKQVLENFCPQFIDCVDADAIVHELKYEDIIKSGDLTTIHVHTTDSKEKNRILHERLVDVCNEEEMIKVCEIMMDADGNPKMRKLGMEMKSALEGRLCVCVCVCVHVCACACVCVCVCVC